MKVVICLFLGLATSAYAANIDWTKCGPVCMMFCPFGNVLDENNCPTCRCNPAPTAVPVDLTTTKCPQVMCDIYCENNNYLLGSDGCPMCGCANNNVLNPF